MPLRQQKLYELGCHLGNQGPRKDTALGSCDKYATVKNSKTPLSILQWNANGLGDSKILELKKSLQDHNIQVALIQETMLRTKDISVPGFTPYKCKCQKEGRNCQGILTLIRNDVTAEVNKLNTNDRNDIQQVKVWRNGICFSLYNIYSPPDETCDVRLQSSILKKTILAGDTNAHSPSWGYDDTNESGKYIEELNNSTNLILLQDNDSKPTLFHRPSGTSKKPDHTLISADIRDQCHWEILEDIGSDHLPILISIQIEKEKQPSNQSTRWNYSKADWDKFRTMSDELLTKIDLNSDINTQFTQFCQATLTAAKSAIPKGSRAKYRVFWNDELETAVKKRKAARKMAQKNPSQENKTFYNKCSAQVKKISKSSKRQHWEKTTKQLDLRKDGQKAWKLMDKLSGKSKRTNPAPLETETGIATTNLKKANAHNNFFSSIKKTKRPNLDKGIKKLTRKMEKRAGPFEDLFTQEFSLSELNNSLKKCKLKKAPGPDQISNEMLVHLSQTGKNILLATINCTWKTGKLPKSWKTAHVSPIPKKGKPKEKVSSYRPISLTSCISKLAERMINTRLYWWLEKSKLLHSSQGGFRRGRQTIDQLIRLTQETVDAFQKREHVTAVFIDLQQAYDHVWRAGLLFKMQKLGIQGNLYEWIKDFLHDRTIATKVNNTVSEKRTLEEGLPQGSALSCTLFLVYINDLAENLDVHNALFADDLVIWTSGKYALDMQRKLNKTLATLSTYCELWKLKINTTKTVYSIFTLSPVLCNSKLLLKVQNSLIEKEENPCYLGVRLDTRLTFKTHIEDVSRKVTTKINLLKRLASSNWGANKPSLRQLYIGYVRAIFDYSAPLQATASSSNQEKLNRKQSQAVHFVCGALRSTPTSACEIDANIEPLQIRRERNTALTLERFKRMDKSNPCRKMVDSWNPTERIKKTSFLKEATKLSEKENFPKERETSLIVPENPPHHHLEKPTLHAELLVKADKSTPQPILKLHTYETIASYPEDIIHAYTDGSAVRATLNGGYGSIIYTPKSKPIELSGPCGAHCSNYEAEIEAIIQTLNKILELFKNKSVQPTDIVLFTDSQSAILAIDDWQGKASHKIAKIVAICDNIKSLYNTEITIQWIPGHSDIPNNEKADKLAKAGSRMEQHNIETSYETAKQIAKLNSKETWHNTWMSEEKGRQLHKYLPAPNVNDPIHKLNRKEYCNIFRLRTGHSTLNFHRNRLDPTISPNCRHCNYHHETVEHHLLQCKALAGLRNKLLPQSPNIENCLFGSKDQLEKTSKYHVLASRGLQGLIAR